MELLTETLEVEFVSKSKPRCRRCWSEDVFAVPADGALDRLAWAAWYSPFQCRACHKRSYQRIQKLLEEE